MVGATVPLNGLGSKHRLVAADGAVIIGRSNPHEIEADRARKPAGDVEKEGIARTARD
jgi:hypothetical protein